MTWLIRQVTELLLEPVKRSISGTLTSQFISLQAPVMWRPTHLQQLALHGALSEFSFFGTQWV